MSWRSITEAAWIALAVGVGGLVVLSRRSEAVTGAGAVLRRVMARTVPRAAVLLVWMWLGWHTFAR